MKKGHIILGVILLFALFVFIPNGAAETYSQVVISPDYSSSWEITYDDVDVDEDKDGVLDYRDNCLGTLPEVAVDEKGCPKVMEMEVMSPKHNEIYSPGQDIVVEGRVWNDEGGHPVEGVKIKIDLYDEGSGGWELDLDPANPEGEYMGPFSLTGIPQGIYTLIVTASKTGYPDVSKTIKNITIGGVTTDNDCETPVKKTQLEIWKEMHEINMKSIAEAKEKAKATKDSPISDAEFFDEMEKIDKEIDELVAWIEETNKYTDDVKLKKLIEEHKTKTKKLKMELRVAKAIKEVYSDKYAKSVIEVQRLKGIIKTKDNEKKTMWIDEGKHIKMILDKRTEINLERLEAELEATSEVIGGGTWCVLKYGMVGWFRYFTGTEKEEDYGLTNAEMRDRIRDRILLETFNAEVTADHTKFETGYDPASKITTVTVFEDYVTVKSLKTNDPEMIVSAGQRIEITDEGFSPKLELSQDDLMCLADRYTVAFGGINPLLISTNNPPTASFFIMPENPEVGDYIAVASTSSDPDDDKLTYSWYRDGSEIENSPNWEWENPQAGEYNIKLVVEDGKGGSDEYSRKIKVIGPIDIPGFEIGIGTGDKTNNPPIASFIMPQNPKVGDYIAVASTSSDPDGDTLTYSWYFNGEYNENIGNSPNWEWENPQAGEHTIKLVVDDGKGGSDEDSTKIMVIGPTPTGIPGFEIAFLISAIVVALIVIKRRKHNL